MPITEQIAEVARKIEAARQSLSVQMEKLPPASTERAELDAIDSVLFDAWVLLGN